MEGIGDSCIDASLHLEELFGLIISNTLRSLVSYKGCRSIFAFPFLGVFDISAGKRPDV